MDFNTFQGTVKAGTPFDTGQMMDSWLFYDTPYQFVAQADIARTPYFVFNQEGTIYTQKNKGFIDRIVGEINYITYSENLGLPYDYSEINDTLDQRNTILQQQGALEVVK